MSLQDFQKIYLMAIKKINQINLKDLKNYVKKMGFSLMKITLIIILNL